MKAIVLAAGRGSRLKAFTDERPKCLNKVNGRPLIEWQISALRKGGVKEIVIVTGYRSETLLNFNERTVHNRHWEKSNMVSSLLCANSEFNQSLIVSYSDILYNDRIVSALSSTKQEAVVAYDIQWSELWRRRFDNPLQSAETFKINKEGLILDIGRRPDKIEDIQGQYLGLMRFSSSALSWIENYASQKGPSINKMDMTTLLMELISKGYPIYGMAINGGWCEIDTPEDLGLANSLFAEGKLDLCSGSTI